MNSEPRELDRTTADRLLNFGEDVLSEPCQDTSYGDWQKERFGNNRKKVPKSVAKAKRKAAKKARQRNRK